MNVNTIVIPPEMAKAKLDEYRSVVASKRTEEDAVLQSLYKSVVKGARVIDIAEAFKATGLNEYGQPKLAIARADASVVYFADHTWSLRDPTFSIDPDFNVRKTRHHVILPPTTFDPSTVTHKRLRSAVPHIPPGVRPASKSESYHVLFEVQNWSTYPVDPFLLRRITGYIYVVEAEWELTPLEASLLASIQKGN
jgi:hypothetical protein